MTGIIVLVTIRKCALLSMCSNSIIISNFFECRNLTDFKQNFTIMSKTKIELLVMWKDVMILFLSIILIFLQNRWRTLNISQLFVAMNIRIIFVFCLFQQSCCLTEIVDFVSFKRNYQIIITIQILGS